LVVSLIVILITSLPPGLMFFDGGIALPATVLSSTFEPVEGQAPDW
jgi:hypothetical protein